LNINLFDALVKDEIRTRTDFNTRILNDILKTRTEFYEKYVKIYDMNDIKNQHATKIAANL
jgi:hypothetical protein